MKLARFARPVVYNRAGLAVGEIRAAGVGADASAVGKEALSDYLRLLEERVLIFDGAMGTQLMALDLSADDFGGARYHGCNEALVLSRPDLVREIHRAYLAAGADVVETDSFMGSRFKLDRVRPGRSHGRGQSAAPQR